jgi:tetratricopeptide (TPR) repeat protein
MRFTFIPNGLVWQQFVTRLFVVDRDRGDSPVRGFETVSSERFRDYGLDGFSTFRGGTIFQMYYPLWEPEEPRHQRVNQKLKETINKLKKNSKNIEEVIGEKVKRLVLVIPEDPDTRIRKYQHNAQKDSGIEIEIWGETEISSLVIKHYLMIKDYLPLDFDRPHSYKKTKKAESIPKDIRNFLEEGIKHRDIGNYEEARKLFQKSMQWASKKKHKIAEAEAKRGLGIILFEKDKNISEAISLLEESLNLFRKHGSAEKEVWALSELGRIKIEEGKLDEAWAYFSRTLEIDKKTNRLFGIAWDLHQLGWIEDHRGNLKEALQLYDQALSKFFESRQNSSDKDDPATLHSVGACYHHKGIIYERQARLEEAVASFTQALDWEKKSGFKPDLIRALFFLAKVKYRQNQYKDATKYLDEAIVIAVEIKDSHFLARCLELKARYYYTIGDKEKSLETFQKALDALSGDDQERIKYLNQLSLFLIETDNLDLAKTRLKEALETPTSENLLEERVVAIERLARIALIENKTQEREELLNRARKILEQILTLSCPKPRRAYALGWLGALNEKLENSQEALIWYEKARKEYEDIGDIGGIASSLGSIAHVKGLLGNGKEEFETYRELKKLVDGTGFYDMIAGTAINLGNIYLNLGNLSEAKNMLQEANLLCKKYNLHYEKELRKSLERYYRESEIRKPPELDFRELVEELYELINWFPEAKDNILRLWMWSRQEALLANYRSLDGIKFVIYEDGIDNFLNLAKFLASFSDLCLQVVSLKYPGVGLDIVPFPPHKEIFFDCAVPYKEKIGENQYVLKFAHGGINSRYTLVSDKAVSKQTGNEAAVITGWSIGLPEQAHRLILSCSKDEIIKNKVFFLPYERHLSMDPLPNDLGFTKDFGMLPVYFGHLPICDEVEVIRRKSVEVPYIDEESSKMYKSLVQKIRAALSRLTSTETRSIKSNIERLVTTIENLNTIKSKCRLDIYFLEFPSFMKRERYVAIVVKDNFEKIESICHGA